MVSLHSDNGSESTPGHLTRFCHARDITFIRSRPYQGNDNAYVEEKNNSVIRKFVGYDRTGTPRVSRQEREKLAKRFGSVEGARSAAMETCSIPFLHMLTKARYDVLMGGPTRTTPQD